ncbi:radical SAM protein [Geomonas sp. RF6]|uniref:B12-binding domain-containing radical SAM protein n=1 Tax=Geomonas sp. RF6 TaxID=2897342 RepID=UPI001E440BCC|nr:radical SAM protein [Geomonas sp. RF6]UFS71467.1 radical SAM protein [Geomonas sp. RF6]
MRVLLISANTEKLYMPPLPLGLNCVAKEIRKDRHQVRLVDLMGSGDNQSVIRHAIEEMQPQVIGISVRNVDNQNMAEPRFLLEPVREAVELCRTLSDATIVVGGAAFSLFPGAILSYLGADIGICGEGEVAFANLLLALEDGWDPAKIGGVWLPGQKAGSVAYREDLDILPLPDPSLWNVPAGLAGETCVPLQTRRGCAMRCSYCSTSALEGTRIRKYDIDKVVEALGEHVAAGFTDFYFVDNTFNLPRDYAKYLCEDIIKAGWKIRWRCILYPGFIDEKLVKKMADAGCFEVSLGFESGSPLILKKLNKKYTTDQVQLSSELLRKHGIRRMGFLLLGGPGETRETVQESLDFADSLRLDMLKVTTGIRIYPGTALEKIARKEGVIARGDDLLHPRFYLAKGLEPWLAPLLREWMSQRPYCIT